MRRILTNKPDVNDIKTWHEVGWGINNCSPFYFSPGVYALLVKGEIVYVGSTTVLGFRVSGHELATRLTRSGVRKVTKLICPCDNHKDVEKELIGKLNPKYNTQYRTDLPKRKYQKNIEKVALQST